ncbi:MAG TPA: MBL fold metallo-hydrolase [Terriglobales bacterium]|nr:MBL fold metallo-hydrolase [Terriglobales bacterium]
MQIYPGAELIECEIVGRPLYLPLLKDNGGAMLIDCGTRKHATEDVPRYLMQSGIDADELAWLVVTHPDGDHCGGTAEIKKRYPRVQIACGDADCKLVESPHDLFEFRYDGFRQDHGIFFDEETAQQIKNCSSTAQAVSVTFIGGETIRLGENRILEIWHLPGHSYGHLGVYDRNNSTLFYGDAIQGAGYRSLNGGWALCPTYLYVDAYLQTIRIIENSPAEIIVGCHWPVLRGKESIRQFCAQSRDFVMYADLLIAEYLRRRRSGVTMRELCERLSEKLGEWPYGVHLELANAISGHLHRGVETGRLEVDRSTRPFQYRIRES